MESKLAKAFTLRLWDEGREGGREERVVLSPNARRSPPYPRRCSRLSYTSAPNIIFKFSMLSASSPVFPPSAPLTIAVFRF